MKSWSMDYMGKGIRFEVDRLRREHNELIGELTVYCHLPGAKTIANTEGVLISGDFNFSSIRARQERAKLLAMRARSGDQVDWYGLLEEFCLGVLARERHGDDSIDIWDLALPPAEDDFSIHGIFLPRRLPSILFGDGGSAKSYFGLYLAGQLAKQGINVAFCDWEMSGTEHRQRMEYLFRLDTPRPRFRYLGCSEPLHTEIDRIRHMVKDHAIRYAIFDSISVACGGRPEEAEIAARYFLDLRQLDIGSLHIAHTNKSEAADQKPFGSAFWHNLARSTWFIQASREANTSTLGFFNRKSNTGPLRSAVAVAMTFGCQSVEFGKGDLTTSPELSAKLPIWQRMIPLLQVRGPMTMVHLAEELDTAVDTIKKAVKRSKAFRIIEGATGIPNRVGLAEGWGTR